MVKITSQEEILMKTLMKFFAKKSYLKRMVDIKNGNTNISLRILDWFATRYSDKYKIKYPKDVKNRKIFIYFDYKDQVKAYKKKNFDPFCRGDKIILKDKKIGEIETTVGQLNFFRWVFSNKILDIIVEDLEYIKEDMAKNHHKKAKGGGKTNLWKIHLKNAYPIVSKENPNLKFPQIIKKISALYQEGKIYKNPVKTKKKKSDNKMKISAKKSITKHNVKIIVKFE